MDMARKRATSVKPVTNPIVSNYLAELTMNQPKYPRIFLNGEVYPVEEVSHNQTQVHFTIDGGMLRCLRYRLNEIDDDQLITLQILMPTYVHLTELRFEFCHLTYDHFVFIRIMLQENKQIAFVSVSGNREASGMSSASTGFKSEYHHILIHNTELKSYTAQLCDLKAPAIRLFCSVLTKVVEVQHLLSLNLACNDLRDEGCARIASMLRENRTLQALNIADNKISPAGLLQLIESFGEFQLTTAEWQHRRRIMLQSKAKKYFPNWVCKDKHSMSSISRINSFESGIVSYDANVAALMTMHPFIKESYIRGDIMFCSGNNTLLHLNISCTICAIRKHSNQRKSFADNDITPAVLEHMIDAVSYQKSKFKIAGLQQVVAESNRTHPKLQQLLQDTLLKD